VPYRRGGEPAGQGGGREALSKLARMRGLVFFALSLLLRTAGFAEEHELPLVGANEFNYPAYMEIPAELRAWFRNPDGSCVQCAEGLTGMHNNLPPWTFLLFDTDEYGKAQHGGSYPGRVAAYAKTRGMRIFNVTGNSFEDTRAWMIWAARTNRFCAIGAGGAHFQCLYGYIPGASKPWLVNNNNSTSVIDDYSEDGFRRLHMASGPWIVVPDEPASAPPPRVIEWWK
jgi:hypothetical protein